MIGVIFCESCPDLEVTARHLNEVEAVQQHVHLTNIPVWFGLLGDV